MTSNVVPIGTRPTRTNRTSIPGTEVYTVKEVSRLLRLSLGSTYALVQDGTIPAKRVGSRWVIPKRRFHAWLNDEPEAAESARMGTGGR